MNSFISKKKENLNKLLKKLENINYFNFKGISCLQIESKL